MKLFRKVRTILSNRILMLWYPLFALKSDVKYFDIFTHLTIFEKLLLYRLALSLKGNSTIVEIGSYLGASSSFMASAARQKGHTVFCVDTWMNENMSEGMSDMFESFNKNVEGLKDYIRVMRGKSVDMAETFDRDIDLLFIDGDHSYEGVRADVCSWLPKVKNGGLVAFHDSGWAEGVKQVIKEFVRPICAEEYFTDNMYWARIQKK